MRTAVGSVFLALLGVVAMASTGLAVPAPVPEQLRPDIRLVLVIVADQLNADMLENHVGTLGSAGFRRLIDEGVVFRNTFMAFSPTSTGPGHATLATGDLPPVHGIAANWWKDRTTGKTVYCSADPAHKLLAGPTYPPDGTSPRQLQTATFSDELYEATDGKSRAFAFSVKDRAAILLAGHHGKAVWYLRREGAFSSSDYYFDAPPAWLARFNAGPMAGINDAVWTLSRPRSDYRFGDRDDQPWERNLFGLGRTFPHSLATSNNPPAALRFIPLADELTVDLAILAAEAEDLGQSTATDMLLVSLSTTDYVGHAFGPDSLEWEDNLLRLDAQVARLLEWADRRVGLAHTLVALSSDHAITSAPEYASKAGAPVGRVDVPGMLKGLRARLADRFDLDGDPLLAAMMPSIYLNAKVLAAAEVDMAEAERVAAAFVADWPGIDTALTRSDLLAGDIPPSPQYRRVLAGYHPGHSGDVIVIQSRGWHLDDNPNYYAITHGSPYDYDAHVPMMFLAPGVPAQVVDRPVGTENFAPSITGYLGLEGTRRTGGEALPELSGGGAASPYNPGH